MFKCVKTSLGSMNVPPTEYKELGENVGATFGEALAISGGKLVKPTTKVEYISLKDQENGLIPVMAVSQFDVYQCEITLDPTLMEVGDIVTLSSNGQNIGEVDEDGVAVIVNFPEEKGIGKSVQVKFI